MTLYKEHIQINKRFQTSINLGLDLNSEEKIHEYIPTTDICDAKTGSISSDGSCGIYTCSICI